MALALAIRGSLVGLIFCHAALYAAVPVPVLFPCVPTRPQNSKRQIQILPGNFGVVHILDNFIQFQFCSLKKHSAAYIQSSFSPTCLESSVACGWRSVWNTQKFVDDIRLP